MSDSLATDRVCEGCEESVPRGRRKWCTRECKDRYYARLWHHRYKKAHGEHYSDVYRRVHGRSDPVFEIVCQQCGEVATVKKRSARFCSQECWQESKRPVYSTELVHVGSRRQLRIEYPCRVGGWWKFFVAGPCAWCSSSFVARASEQAVPKYCSESCKQRASYHRRGWFEFSPRRRLAIYERDGWRCQIPGCLFRSRLVNRDVEVPHPRAAVLDHIVPRSLGGSDEDANLQTAHFRCNSVKAAQVLGAGEQLRMIG